MMARLKCFRTFNVLQKCLMHQLATCLLPNFSQRTDPVDVPVSTFIDKTCPQNHRDDEIEDAEIFFSSSNASTARLPPAVVEDAEYKSDPDSDLVFNAGPRPRKTKQLISTLLCPSDCEENGNNEAPTKPTRTRS
jgi:hypothetical protein